VQAMLTAYNDVERNKKIPADLGHQCWKNARSGEE
jgi:hypothetical protein